MGLQKGNNFLVGLDGEISFLSPPDRPQEALARWPSTRIMPVTNLGNCTWVRVVSIGALDYPVLQCSIDLILDELFQLLAVDNAVYDTLGFVVEPEARRETVKKVSQSFSR